jgi:hypothetical protein
MEGPQEPRAARFPNFRFAELPYPVGQEYCWKELKDFAGRPPPTTTIWEPEGFGNRSRHCFQEAPSNHCVKHNFWEAGKDEL